MGIPRRALKFAIISSACLSRSFMLLGRARGLGSCARSLMKGEAALAAGGAGRAGRAPGALFAVSQKFVRHVKLAHPWSPRRCLLFFNCLIHVSFLFGTSNLLPPLF